MESRSFTRCVRSAHSPIRGHALRVAWMAIAMSGISSTPVFGQCTLLAF
jgi:hypothetical protein